MRSEKIPVGELLRGGVTCTITCHIRSCGDSSWSSDVAVAPVPVDQVEWGVGNGEWSRSLTVHGYNCLIGEFRAMTRRMNSSQILPRH